MNTIYAASAVVTFALMIRAEYRFARQIGVTVRKRTIALYAVLSLIPVANLILAAMMTFGSTEQEEPFFEDGIYPRDD